MIFNIIMKLMIERSDALDRITQAFRVHPVVALLGPRQCGKTTLAMMLVKGEKSTYFDLENPADLRRFESPLLALEALSDRAARLPKVEIARPAQAIGREHGFRRGASALVSPPKLVGL